MRHITKKLVLRTLLGQSILGPSVINANLLCHHNILGKTITNINGIA